MQRRQRALNSLHMQQRRHRQGGGPQRGEERGSPHLRELLRCCQRVVDGVGVAFTNTTLSMKRLQKTLQASSTARPPPWREGGGRRRRATPGGGGGGGGRDAAAGGEDHVDTSEDALYRGFRFPARRPTSEAAEYTAAVERLLLQAWQEQQGKSDPAAAARRAMTMELHLTEVEGGGLRLEALMRHLRLFARFLQAIEPAQGSVSRWVAAHHHAAAALVLACLAEHLTRRRPSEPEVVCDPGSLLGNPTFCGMLRDAAAAAGEM